VSIVIATAERPRLVLDCVRSWREQVPQDVELIVVDAGREMPVDEDALLVLWPNARVICSDVRNAGIQRNMGVEAANADVVIFLDDDTYVQPGWWPAILDPLAEVDVAVSAGAVWCNPTPVFTDKRGGYINWRGEPEQVTHRSEKAPRDVDWPMTTNMAVRRAVYRQIGGICKVYGIYDEDVDLGLVIREAGWRIVFQPSAAVYHYYAKMQRKPLTKSHYYRLGRNRSILLVRHYGLFSRLLIFLALMPFLQLGAAFAGIGRTALRAVGHAGAYMVGAFAGVWVGWQNRK